MSTQGTSVKSVWLMLALGVTLSGMNDAHAKTNKIAHPRGIWRRTTLEEFRNSQPRWETVLDIDALNKAEGKRWVFKGAQCLEPGYQRCLISLSPDGGDAVAVREFDMSSKTFVKHGFELPVAKSEVDWIDQDHIYVGTDFGPGSMTASSYPRIVKEWTRGTALATATTIFAGKPTDLAVAASHDRTPLRVGDLGLLPPRTLSTQGRRAGQG
jgi:prolyl oligopeptidase